MTVMFTSVPRLITQIKEARQERALRSLENRFINYDLVICDEFGYVSCDKRSRRIALQPSVSQSRKEISNHHYKPGLQQMERDYRRQSPRDSNVDRLTHKAVLINMTGESFRMKETKKTLQNQL